MKLIPEMIVRWRLLIISLICILLGGCAAKLPDTAETYMDYGDEQLQQPILSLEEIVEKVTSREQVIRTLKTSQKITFHDRINFKTRKVKGFIAFLRPENYRIQLTTIMGITVMDMLNTTDDRLIDIPHLNKTIEGDSEDWKDVKNYFPFEEFPAFFVHDLLMEGAMLKVIKNKYVISYFKHTDTRYQPVKDVWIATDTLLVSRIDMFREEFVVVSFRYDDYRPVMSDPYTTCYLPFQSEIHLPMKKVSIYLEADNFQLNSEFPPGMFERTRKSS